MYFPRDYRAKYFFQSERDCAQVNLDWNCDEFLKINSSQAGRKGKKRNRRSLYRWKTIADRLKWQIFLLPLFLVRPENPISSTSSASVTRECPRIDSPSFHYNIIAAVSQAYSIKTRQSSYIPSWKILSCPTISNLNLSMYIYILIVSKERSTTRLVSFAHHRLTKYANFMSERTVLGRNDGRLIFIQSPFAAFISCRVKSDIKFARSIHLYLFVCQRWAS